MLRLVADGHERLPLFIAGRRRGQRANRIWPPVRPDTTSSCPALISAGSNAHQRTGGLQTRASTSGLVDQRDCLVAIRGADHSSSPSPQIARAFFDKINKDADSSRDLSFRCCYHLSSRWRRRDPSSA